MATQSDATRAKLSKVNAHLVDEAIAAGTTAELHQKSSAKSSAALYPDDDSYSMSHTV